MPFKPFSAPINAYFWWFFIFNYLSFCENCIGHISDLLMTNTKPNLIYMVQVQFKGKELSVIKYLIYRRTYRPIIATVIGI
jgi:hypothetical protein